jgi:20S proteasome subunit alpha 1
VDELRGLRCCRHLTQAVSAGTKDREAVNFLEKKAKDAASLTFEQAVQLAIGALQNVLSEDLKASDIEVSFLSH